MQRILVIHRGSLGDFLLLLPSIAMLRQNYPGARIEMLGRPEILSLACPGVADTIASVERASLVPFFEGNAPLPQSEVAYFSSFDMVLALIADPSAVLERNLATVGVKNIIVRPPFPPPGERVHVGRYLCAIVEPLLGNSDEPPQVVSPLLRFTEEETRWAADFLKSSRPGDRQVAAIHPGSGSEKKCWPTERFEALVRYLTDSGYGMLFILGPADQRLSEPMTALANELGCPVAHNIPLRRLTAVLSNCDVYVGNDSGVTHLAAATSIPTIVIFGPTDPNVWAPLGKNVPVLSSSVECAPCERETMRSCGELRCLAATSVDDVSRAVREALDAGVTS